jgi:CheY-like chemotaxis protein
VTGKNRTRILVVDDVAGQRLAIEAALEELGEEIVSVGSGAEALRLLLEDDFAVILLDVNMPDMDGFETATLIRERPRSRHTPIIFLTATTDEMAAMRAYSLGAVDYIFNPFPPEVLRAKVKVFAELSKMHERLRHEAEQRLALTRAQAARTVAEEESRRLRFLAEASGMLAGSLDPAALVADLLVFFVPRLADLSVITLLDDLGQVRGTSWLQAGSKARVSRDPIPPAAGLDLEPLLRVVITTGKAETIGHGDTTRAIVLPLLARERTLGALAVAMGELGRCYAEADLDLVRDVASRAAIALDNGRLHQEIQERDRQKDEFLAMLSHELRNPLGAITTAMRLLDITGSRDPHAVRAREVITRQTTHLTRMVDDLLDVARITVGRIALSRATVDLGAVVERTIEALRVSGRLEHHRVSTTLSRVMVEADTARLEQVITNLLINAVKYTDRGGRIDVEVGVDGAEALVLVRDTGIGINADILPRLFDLFAQGRQALDRAQGGLGIGLTLVRRLVELHGGRVEVWSDGPGRGSVFTVRLPRVPEALSVGDRALEPARAAAPLRILVVEDNQDAREMLRTVLELEGHQVDEAADGLQALQLVGRTKPQLALVDLGLPGIDGLELASRIRAMADGRAMVLVAVTGYGQASDRRRSLDAGFELHLTKPVDPTRLDEVLAFAARRLEERRVFEQTQG